MDKEVKTEIANLNKLKKTLKDKILNNFETCKALPDSVESVTSFNVLKKLNGTYFDKINEINLDIQIKFSTFNANKKLLAEFSSETADFQAEYIQALTALEQRFVNLNTHNSQPPTPPPVGVGPVPFITPEINVKLPDIKLKEFSGHIEEWTDFWSTFQSSIDSNPRLNPIAKFNYLKSLISGNAARLIASIPLTNDGYVTAVDILTSRFNKSILSNRSNLHKLFAYCDNIKLINRTNMTAIHDDILAQTLILKNSQIDESSYNDSVIYKLLPKLPEYMQLKIHRHEGQFTVDDLLKLFADSIDYETTKSLYKTPNNTTPHRQDRPRPQPRTNPTSTMLLSNRKIVCFICGGEHVYRFCILPVMERIKIVESKGLCKVCLRKHNGSQCVDTRFHSYSCYVCNQKHNRALCQRTSRTMPHDTHSHFTSQSSHPVSFTQNHNCNCNTSSSLNPEAQQFTNPSLTHENPSSMLFSNSSEHRGFSHNNQIYLQTAKTNIVNSQNNLQVSARILFDSGSQKSYISENLARQLNLPILKSENVKINTFGNATNHNASYVVKFSIHNNKFYKEITARTIPEICSPIDNVSIPSEFLPEIASLDLADREIISHPKLPIDILIGADYFWNFMLGYTFQTSFGPVVTVSPLGHILSGVGKVSSQSSVYRSCFISEKTIPTNVTNNILSQQVSQFWDLDSIGITFEEKDYSHVLDKFERDLTFSQSDNRYQSSLLFKNENVTITNNNKALAVQRLNSLLRKLKKDDHMLKLYDQTILDQEKSGIVSKVPYEEIDRDNVYYLPHSGVYKESSDTTKLRIVYDGSAHMKNCLSLNSYLHTGPNLLTSLCGNLLKFRIYPFILIGDIKKAYHQILLRPADRDYTRFIWTKNPDNPEEFVVYRFNRIPFGLGPSGFILNATLRYHILKHSNLDKQIAEKLSESYYADNLIFGFYHDDDSSLDILNQIHNMHENVSMPLNKYCSNSSLLRSEFKHLETNWEDKKVESLLGLNWDFHEDTISFKLENLLTALQIYKVENPPLPTKRQILSHMSTLFDPMGYLVPILLFAKILFQQLCIDNLGWDSQISELQFNSFLKWISLVDQVSEIKLKRCCLTSYTPKVKFGLRGYCDASKDAYAACIYLVIFQDDNIVSGNLLICKGRISPIKKLSIPKLELLAGLLLARLMKTVTSLLVDINIEIIEYYSDSTTVLHWINGRVKDWNAFVVRKINEINENSIASQWGYVPTLLNKADIPSRGISSIDQINSWYVFNEQDINLHLNSHPWQDTPPIELSVELSCVAQTPRNTPNNISEIIDISRFSKLNKLLNVTMHVLKFICLLKKRSTSHLRIQAEKHWIKAVQTQHLDLDYQTSSKPSPLFKQFNLFKDSDGIYRCQTRVRNANVSYGFKHPILLQTDHPYTRLLILRTHETLAHASSQQMLFVLRELYWIPRARRLISHLLKQCVTCQKLFKPLLSQQPFADIPKFRLEESFPFTYSALDFAGPFLVKMIHSERQKRDDYDFRPKVNASSVKKPPAYTIRKVYVLVLNCMVTRAVHIEMTYGMSSDDFIKALRRFASTCGLPSIIYSDNFSTFKCTDRDLSIVLESKQLSDYLRSEDVEWKYSTPNAPWCNGFSERLVGVVKRNLHKTLYKAFVSVDDFVTVLKEIEAIVNSRPISYNVYDLENLKPISPNMLLHGRNLPQIPFLDRKFIIDHVDNTFVSKRLAYLESLKTYFWQIFHKEYISNLSEIHFRQSRNDNNTKLNIGDLCLLDDRSKSPRFKWNLVRITNLIEGRDNIVRSADVKYLNDSGKINIVRRPINLLVPLEISSNDAQD